MLYNLLYVTFFSPMCVWKLYMIAPCLRLSVSIYLATVAFFDIVLYVDIEN